MFFSNFSGKCYGDNPRYISETLHILYPQISIVWLKHKGYDFETPEYVKQIKWPSVRMIKELCTARVWVDSHTKPIYIKKRKGQYFIETWHGGLGIKKIEDDVIGKQSFSYIVNFLHNTKMVDVFLSNSTWISNIYRETFHYKGKIIECGYPKNDIFFQNNVGVIAKVKKNLGLTSEKIVLYAPTFRNQSTIDWFDIDFIKLHECLEAQFNCKYIILIKLHPLMMKQSKKCLLKFNS